MVRSRGAEFHRNRAFPVQFVTGAARTIRLLRRAPDMQQCMLAHGWVLDHVIPDSVTRHARRSNDDDAPTIDNSSNDDWVRRQQDQDDTQQMQNDQMFQQQQQQMINDMNR